ncbi:hypothetical protein TcBrA4_0046040 [Trypanosoma cruzi]|nr:hypothetical protein TcBrA4_0046040 [Trypanosoma cruzi]
MDRTPLDMDSGVAKDCGAIGEEAGAPLDKGMGGWIPHSRADWKATCCFLNCVDNGELSFRDCGLNPQQFHAGAGREHNFGLVRGVKDGEGRLPPSFAVRQDTRAGRVRHYNVMQYNSTQRKLTNLTTAHVEQSLVSWNATAHSTKQGALRHAAPIVETCNLDSHVILQLAMHVDPFDLPQSIV